MKMHRSANSADGAAVYAAHCIKCHGPDGAGVAGVISIAGPSLKAEHDRGAVVDTVLHGKGIMPSFKPVLSPALINAVADYVTTQLATIPLAPGDLGEGGTLFRIDCAPCHGVSARGGAIAFAGTNAPSLVDKSAAMIAGTVRWGPGLMPSFPPAAITDQQLDSIVTYVQFLQHPPSPGGAPMQYFGSVAEGLIGWLGAFIIVAIAMWIERGGKG
jgi:ubiquinol-cytochrome c reductase cytochrome c subunit